MASKIEHNIQEKLQDFFKQTITNENISKIKQIHEASKWIKITKDRDEFLSNIANNLVSKLIEKSSIPFVDLIVGEIRVNTSNKDPSIKFNASFTIRSLKPYIKLVKCEDGIPTETLLKTVFQIDSDGTMTDIQIQFKEKTKVITSGKLNLEITLSMIAFNAIGLSSNKQITLRKQKYSIDLSSCEL